MGSPDRWLHESQQGRSDYLDIFHEIKRREAVPYGGIWLRDSQQLGRMRALSKASGRVIRGSDKEKVAFWDSQRC